MRSKVARPDSHEAQDIAVDESEEVEVPAAADAAASPYAGVAGSIPGDCSKLNAGDRNSVIADV